MIELTLIIPLGISKKQYEGGCTLLYKKATQLI